MKQSLQLGCFFLILLVLITGGLSQSQDYLPLTPQELGQPFKLTKVGELPGPVPVHITTAAGVTGSNYQVSTSGSLLFLSGKDKAGIPWSVDLFWIGGVCGARLYETDLDGDGVMDAVIVRDTGGNGLAPSSHLLTITFDEKGRPIPFEAEGYFMEKDGFVDALIDLDRNGRADLVFMNYNDGYWITHIYSVFHGRWSRVSGQFASHVFPLFTRFTNRPNKVPVIPPTNRHPHAPDLSNLSPTSEGRLAAWSWPDQYKLNFILKNDDGAQVVGTPNYWFDSARLVIDLPSGRRVAHLSYEERANVIPLLNEIVSRKLRVVFYGQRDKDHCCPELIWASEQ